MRDDEVIDDNLTLQSLKHHKQNVSQIVKGNECGLVFNPSKHGVEYERGDIVECYSEK